MQVAVEEINELLRKVSIEIPADMVDAEIEKAYTRIRKKARVEGFRPGKAPMDLIKRAHSDAMREEVMGKFYEKTFLKALQDHEINPVSPPIFEKGLLAVGTPFRYSAEFEILPEVQINDYIGLTVAREKYLPSPEIVEEEIQRAQEEMAKAVAVGGDTLVQNGHIVSFQYLFSVEGHPEMDASADDATVEVGAGAMMPGFEEQLVGMKCGDTKDIRVAQPEEAGGREGVFRVTLKEIKRKELPELDDEFARRCGECETMDALRAKVAGYLQEKEMERIEYDLHERLIKALVARNPLTVPYALVNSQLDHMLENFKKRLEGQDMTMQTAGIDHEAFESRFRKSAEEKVKADLLLMALVRKEKLAVTDEDLDDRYERMAGGNSGTLDEIREYFAANSEAKNSLLTDIKVEKAICFLNNNAVITEVEAAELMNAA